MSAFLFITDLDNTFVGDDTALKTLKHKLTQHREEHGTKIVYATGRSLFLYRQLEQEKHLLSPDALITSVGTEIYFNPSEEVLDSQWADILSQGWDRKQVCEVASQFKEMTPQPESEQNHFKASYFIEEQVAIEVIPQLKTALADRGLKTKIIYSGSLDLDILPEKGDKGLAVQYLRQKWSVEAEKTVVCGDSGNDIALFRGAERGIIVGNAKIELRQWYETNQTPYRYLAKTHYANGILEGLKHFNFLH
ncbi:sucrose phosphatase [Gloeothece citriformis PCC 7424]|uniref:sucrose-phosphate phosphatase n=1 Tax=Gloeothece citriformis (strain PCC 7424) TaxID=65393 RepID=B7K971_GLOC7|nr:sucrose-phosphate phosphatase [Gloeothece citriformis]ACK72840.1 sucrose phosphatase [Gloeothece citriformis PCC 7424]